MKINPKLVTKDYIRGTLTNNQTITNNYVNILYNKDVQFGTGLELSDGSITVKSDSIKVLAITASLKTSDWSSGLFYVKLLKNEVEYEINIQETSNVKSFFMIPVEKNDVIKIQCYCSTQKNFDGVNSAYNYTEILGI